MLRGAWWTLRQARYARFAAAMFVLAVICVAAGTWQVQRFQQSVRDNGALRRNAHAAAVPLSTQLVPLVQQRRAPGRAAIEFRTVTASGSYVPGSERYVRNKDQTGSRAFSALDAFDTGAGTLLVMRGYTADPGTRATAPAAPPPGRVRLVGRLQPASTTDDAATAMAHGELESVNAVQQAARLGTPVFDGYLVLGRHQPGTAGVTALPAPDLSNPAGGAYEAQHFAYILQWYLFAALALAAPFLLARSEVRDARRRYLGIDPGEEQLDDEQVDDEPVDAGPQRAALAGTAVAGAPASGSELVSRGGGELAMRSQVSQLEWERGARLADRYGRSLQAAPDGAPARRRYRRTVSPVGPTASRSSAERLHRSTDGYHGAYNDYLWQLALADGDLPELTDLPEVTRPAARIPAEPTAEPTVDPRPRIIEGTADESPA